jgi:hypothetical protein
MKQIVTFANSTGIMVMGEGKSYIERFHEEYRFTGKWMEGITILHVLHYMTAFLRGLRKTVLIHVGATEAFSFKAPYFLHYNLYDMIAHRLNTDPYFMSYIAPKMLQAAADLEQGREGFYRRLLPHEAETLWNALGQLIKGMNVIVIGMTNPRVTEETQYLTEQAVEYNDVLERVCNRFGFHFINVFNLSTGLTMDSNHLVNAGHELIYNRVKPLMEL